MRDNFEDGDVNTLFDTQSTASEDAVEETSRQLDERGIHRPIKDGLENDGKDTLSDDDDPEPSGTKIIDADAETSEEEAELPGTRRPKRGE